MKTDSLFYRLFQERPDLVFELAEWSPPAGVRYTLHAEDVKQTGFRLDGILSPPIDRTDLPLFFLEAQFQTDNDFYARWFAEIFLFLFRQPTRRTAWRAVVIFRDRSIDSPIDEAYRPLLELPWVRRIYLQDLLQHPAPSQGLQLLQLIIEEPAAAVTKARTLLAQCPPQGDIVDWRALADLIETIMVYKLPRLTREEIRKMLNLTEVELKQTRFYQDVFEEGRQEGWQEGRQHQITMILRMLRRRLGSVGPAQEGRIQALPVAELDALGEALLDFQTSDDLSEWLRQ